MGRCCRGRREEAAGIKEPSYKLYEDRLAQDIAFYYASDFVKEQNKFSMVEDNLIGYRLAGVRLAVTKFIRQNFIGTTVKDGFFPDIEKILKLDAENLKKVVAGGYKNGRKIWGWSDADRSYLERHMVTPMSKMLARLIYNSKHDSDPEVRKASTEAWDYIHPILMAAELEDIGEFQPTHEYRIKRFRKDFAERWSKETLAILMEWNRQQSELGNSVQSRVLENQPIIDLELELTRNAALSLEQSIRDLDGFPPLPTCDGLLAARKKMLQ